MIRANDIEDCRTIELQDGYAVRVECTVDDCIGPPWKEHDGHGPVSDWRRKESKKPSERILHEDRALCLFYDWQGAVELARRDGWSFTGQFWYYAHGTYVVKNEYARMTAGEIAARAAEEDFRRMQNFARGDWCWLVVKVSVAWRGREVADSPNYCGGIESYSDYWREHAAEQANYLIRQHQEARKARDIARRKETRERNYWAARDVQTIGV